MTAQAALGVPWFAVSRHMLGLRHGQAGARKWRQVWSDHRLKHLPVAEVAALALKQLGSDPN
jgi:tRNA-dihydrouridine synthase A